MSNRIYPSWQQLNELHNPLTEGERYLLQYLDEKLPKDQQWKNEQDISEYKGWLIFAQPYLNGTRPDVIVFNPFVGMVIYEVKDWKLYNYSWSDGANGKELSVSDGRGTYTVKSPVKQVEHYKEVLIGQLVPNIGEAIDANQKQFGLIKTALYFHNAKSEEAQKLFGARVKNLKYFPVFGKDSILNNYLSAIVPDVNIYNSYYWRKDWNKDILFWLRPPFHSIEQGTILKLKPLQQKVAEPASGHYRVRGVAGSGKTQALAYRAGKLASMNLKVLIVTYNITLWHYIKDMIARSPFNFSWGNITFNHFHGFCKDRLNEFGVDWPSSNNYQGEDSLQYFFKAVVPGEVEKYCWSKAYQRYDAILIDEGQDYHYEWYRMLNKHFITSRDEVVVVCDKKQNIYERELDWLDKRVTREGLEKFKTAYTDLTTTFRMPLRVAEMSNKFSEAFELNQELKVAKIEGTPVLLHSQHIVWLDIQEKQWLEYVDHSFQRLKKEGYSPSDIVILLPNHKKGNECVTYFTAKNIQSNHVFERQEETSFHPHKKAFWMGDSRLKMSTIHSFKGWELLNIVLFIPEKAPESNRKLDAIVYTAITRTKENLIVLNANPRYRDFGKNYPVKWHEQNI